MRSGSQIRSFETSAGGLGPPAASPPREAGTSPFCSDPASENGLLPVTRWKSKGPPFPSPWGLGPHQDSLFETTPENHLLRSEPLGIESATAMRACRARNLPESAIFRDSLFKLRKIYRNRCRRDDPFGSSYAMLRRNLTAKGGFHSLDETLPRGSDATIQK